MPPLFPSDLTALLDPSLPPPLDPASPHGEHTLPSNGRMAEDARQTHLLSRSSSFWKKSTSPTCDMIASIATCAELLPPGAAAAAAGSAAGTGVASFAPSSMHAARSAAARPCTATSGGPPTRPLTASTSSGRCDAEPPTRASTAGPQPWHHTSSARSSAAAAVWPLRPARSASDSCRMSRSSSGSAAMPGGLSRTDRSIDCACSHPASSSCSTSAPRPHSASGDGVLASLLPMVAAPAAATEKPGSTPQEGVRVCAGERAAGALVDASAAASSEPNVS
eukprot:366555-Chlamydomonas_euryale.AAC.8